MKMIIALYEGWLRNKMREKWTVNEEKGQRKYIYEAFLENNWEQMIAISLVVMSVLGITFLAIGILMKSVFFVFIVLILCWQIHLLLRTRRGFLRLLQQDWLNERF